jgi:phytoene synthase
MDAFDIAADIVRTGDRDRYLADLFAPDAARRHLFALHAFNVEVARVRETVSDPHLGEIRLQFWRDGLLAENPEHPVGKALAETIATFGLPAGSLDDLIEARLFDLYDDPMPSLNDLEGYAGETSSSLFQMAAIILAGGKDPATADLSGHGGVAYALAGLIRALPVHAGRGQLYLPADLLDRHGVDRDAILSGNATPALRAALVDLAGVARRHLETARLLARGIPSSLMPAFLPLALVEPELDRIIAPGYRPFAGEGMSKLRRQWILWRAARRGMF